MEDKNKTKEQLVDKLTELRQRIAELEASKTELKRVEEILKESEEKFKLLFNRVFDAIVIIDIKNQITDVNEAACRLLGYEKEELLKLSFENIHPDEEMDKIKKAVSRVLKNGTDLMRETSLITKDDKTIPVEAGMVTFKIAGKTHIIGSFRDISERNLAKKRLTEREARYRRLVEGLKQEYFFYSHNTDGVFTYLSPSITNILGYSQEEFMADYTKYLTENPINRDVVPHTEQSIQGKQQPPYEVEVFHKDGSIRRLEVTEIPVFDKEGRVMLVEGIAHDITERKKAEEDVHRRASQAALIYKVGQSVSSKLEIDVLLSEIVTSVRDAFDYYGVMLMLLDEEDKRLKMQSIAGGYVDIFPKDLSHALGEGMTGYAAASGETQISGDVSKNPHYLRVAEEKTKSELSVPIKSGEKVIGVLDLQSDEFDAFDETDVTAMETLSTQISVAIENARLYGQAQREVTERKRAEEEIEKRQKYLESVLHDAPDAIITIDASSRIIEWNRGAEQIFRYTRKEALGKNIDDLITDPGVRDEAADLTKQTLSGKKVLPLETVRYQKDGTPVNVIVAGSTIRIGDELQGIVAVYTDITDRKQAEEALRKSEEKYRTLTENVNIGVYRNTTRPKGKFIETNSAIVKMFGYESKEEFLATEIVDQYQNPEDRKRFYEKMSKDGFLRNEELKLKKKDGKPFIVSVSEVAVKDEKGKVRYYDGIIEDITERKRAEEKIKVALKEKEVLLREIHHRVKNNMQIISSLLNIQSGYIKNKDALDILKESRDRVKSMALIHEKLYKSKDMAMIDFAHYIRDLTTDLYRSYSVNPNAVKLTVNVKDVFLDINAAIPCSLIINELVTNSLKHAFPDGRQGEIIIDLRSVKDNKLTMVVADNGIGFPKDLDFRNTESLGMRLVWILTQQLNGTVELDRETGTKFKITF